MKEYQGRTYKDPNLQPKHWLNKDTAQTHYFVSCLELMIPGAKENCPKIEVKPGKVALIPHSYYTVSTRDGSEVFGGWAVGKAVEEHAKANFKTDY